MIKFDSDITSEKFYIVRIACSIVLYNETTIYFGF